ncbi:hypothetical protein GMO_28020 [Gluconobacter morbifer G707]|uniref:Uncharacterized protein n=1 Tax=Gluconobacter morbifer G707 TaxID=1088869 RepID=G6XMT4_9PROT|nr:hypothetical protein GMO_28020 [Gluconobacter morbifer G707]
MVSPSRSPLFRQAEGGPGTVLSACIFRRRSLCNAIMGKMSQKPVFFLVSP